MSISGLTNFRDVCRQHVADYRRGIELMEAGAMSTFVVLGSQWVETTKESISTYRRYIAELEPLIAKAEAEGA